MITRKELKDYHSIWHLLDALTKAIWQPSEVGQGKKHLAEYRDTAMISTDTRRAKAYE